MADRPRAPQTRRRPLEPAAGFVAVGRVLGPWGVYGDVKVEPLTDFPQRFRRGAALWIAGERATVERSRAGGKFVYLRLAGVEGRVAAEALRDRLLEVPESDLEQLAEGQYYRFQIVGLEVYTSDGRHLGRVAEVLTTGANDVYVVRGPEGETLVPAIADVVRQVDVVTGRLIADPPEVI